MPEDDYYNRQQAHREELSLSGFLLRCFRPDGFLRRCFRSNDVRDAVGIALAVIGLLVIIS